MKIPTYEQQNEFLRKYVAPLFEFNLPKVLRNYRMSKSGPFTDKRMQQIRDDVLADIKDKGRSYSDRIDDFTSDSDTEQVREVVRFCNDTDMATLRMTYTKPLPLWKILQNCQNEMLGLERRHADMIFRGYSETTAQQHKGEKNDTTNQTR